MKFKQVCTEILNLLHISTKNNNLVILICINSITTALIPFVNLYFAMLILDSVFAKYFRQSLVYAFVMILLVFILNCMSKYTDQCLAAKYRFCTNLVEYETVHKSFTLEYEEFDKTDTIEKLHYLDDGINGAGDIGIQLKDITHLLQYCFSSLFSLIFIIFLFFQVESNPSNFFTSQISTLFMILLFICLIVFIFKMQNISSSKTNQMHRENISVNSKSSYIFMLLLDLKHSMDIRLSKLSNLIFNYYDGYKDKSLPMYTQWGTILGKYNSYSTLLIEMYAGISYIFVGAKAFYGLISIGSVLMYTGAINQLITTFQQTVSTYSRISYRFEYLKLHSDFIKTTPKHDLGTLPIEKSDDFHYEFECKNVSFKYPGSSDYVLENVTLKFDIGKRHAIVGKNGAGKTTLIKLLCRLYEPTSGQILLNGVDIRNYDFNQYVRIFSIVFQDYQLFSFPIDENIAAHENTDAITIRKILNDVHILDRINELPKGIYTSLNKDNTDGVILSGGQLQKISIARALYKNAPLIILDEPTAALDPVSESEVYTEFNGLVEGKTSIFISHRMSSCIFCDKIFVFDHGKLIDEGNHTELLKSSSIYSSLWHAQSQHYAKTN